MKRDSRRLFSSIEHLSKLSPALLVRFLHHHPDDFGEMIASGAVPPVDQPGSLDLAVLVRTLTSRGISQALGDALFLVNAFASPRNRRILEEEVQATKPPLDVVLPPDLSDADYAMSVWLARPFPSILEAALSRVTLKLRRTFAYFTPANPGRAADAPAVTDRMLARLAEQLRGGLRSSGCSRGVAVFPFLDCPEEDWFLIRRSRLPERITYFDDADNEVSMSAVLRVYDVVVFDRLTGFLKVNAKDPQQELYRQAFSEMYFRDLRFFIKKNIFTLEPLRSGAMEVVSCEGLPGLSSVDLFSVCYNEGGFQAAKRYDVSCPHWYANTLDGCAPVPKEATEILFARFEVLHAGQKSSHRCRVDAGNTLSFSRDDAARAFETFLRRRGYARGMDELVRDNAA